MHNAQSSTRTRDRLLAVDVLRGLALFAVLLINMTGYNGMSMALSDTDGPLNRAIILLMRFFVEAKGYTMLSLLLGWGTAIQFERAQARGVPFAPRFLRRIVGLFVFGALHSILLWPGDILFLYAFVSLILFAVRRCKPRRILIAAILLLAVTLVITLPVPPVEAFRRWYGEVTGLSSLAQNDNVFLEGTYLQVTAYRLTLFTHGVAYWLFTLWVVLAMALLGFYLGRRKLLRSIQSMLVIARTRSLPSKQSPGETLLNESQFVSLFRWTFWLGLVIGIVGNGLYVLLLLRPGLVSARWLPWFSRLVRTVGAPALMIFYISLVFRLIEHPRWRDRLLAFVPLGRMSLSNYLFQSLICTSIFDGYGLGAYGQVGALGGLVLTITIYWLQLKLSAWWLDRYRLGPVEWLFRTLTYARRQSFRLHPPDEDVHRSEQRASRSPRRLWIAAGVVLFVLVSIGGGWWFSRSRLSPAVEPTPQGPVGESASSRLSVFPPDRAPASAHVLSTPVVQPVDRVPGQIAASGDLEALAFASHVERTLYEIEILTAPPFNGRYPGSPSGYAAGDYIAEQFARYGLEPAGSDGTFFQPFPIEYVSLEREPQLSVIGPDGEIYDAYLPYEDYMPVLRWYAGEGTADASVVWGSNCTPADLDSTTVAGQVVLCRSQATRETLRTVLEHGAAGLLLLANEGSRTADFASPFFETWVPDPLPVLWVYPSMVDELLLGSGLSLDDLTISFKTLDLQTRVLIDVDTVGREACASNGCQGRNVLGVLPGRDPQYADEVIIIGGHYDHMGQSPNGTIWRGANDNASGVAVLLEIARTWHEQGYVPRRTVLFAAWDAEEKGLIGSTYTVWHPSYPLTQTLAMLQLDMVGAGGDLLLVDGDPGLGADIRAIADTLGVETVQTNQGRSDHAPFWQAGVPADLLIWDSREDPNYHRPTDTPDQIDLLKLERVTQITALTALGLCEGEPDIAYLLARREQAVHDGDMQAFLATSSPEIQELERAWFDDLQSLAPTQFTLHMHNLQVLGNTAFARVTASFEHLLPDQADPQPRTAALDVRFEHRGDAWLWVGPDLVATEPVSNVIAAAPFDQQVGLSAVSGAAARQYAEIAALLDQPADPAFQVLLFSNADSLRTSTSLSLPPDQQVWVGPGLIKLTYRANISTSVRLQDALVQLVLAQAGLEQEQAPWLWEGLPLLVRAGQDDSSAQHVLALRDAFLHDQALPEPSAHWAAVEYLRQELGWQGLGALISAAGQDGLDEAFASHLEIEAADFDLLWQTAWLDRLNEAQGKLDALLERREQAILARDLEAFLQTVDDSVPYLSGEQRLYFEPLVQDLPDTLSLSGELVRLEDDGSIQALVTMQYTYGEQDPSVVIWHARLTPVEEGRSLAWAGTPFKTQSHEQVTVLYPSGAEVLARDLLSMTVEVYPQLAERLELDDPESVTIKLYATQDQFLTSLPVNLAVHEWLSGWAQAGASLKLSMSGQTSSNTYRSMLVEHLARHLLSQYGVQDEWLLRGVSLHLASQWGPRSLPRSLSANLDAFAEAAESGTLFPLSDIPPLEDLSEQDLSIINTQTWQAVRDLDYAYTWQALLDLIHAASDGQPLDQVFVQSTGQSLSGWESGWTQAAVRAYVSAEQIETANAFDPDRAMAHVIALTAPELAGRQAGSTGARLAAEYIAEQFAVYGLEPVVEITSTMPGQPALSWIQSFSISTTVLLDVPVVELRDADGRVISFEYRHDYFLPPDLWTGGTVDAQLVLVPRLDYEGMSLGGRVVLRPNPGPIELELAEAVAHGAGGLILIGEKLSTKTMMSKHLPTQDAAAAPIPVVVLSGTGQDSLAQVLDVFGVALDALPVVPALPLDLTAHLDLPLSPLETAETANVLALIPGSDPQHNKQAIIIGAHYDYVGDDPGLVYPGANDNASGVAVLLEMARVWHEADYRPRHSILLVAWGAQEMGELGAHYYINHPVWPLEQTMAMIQLDAVAGGDGYYLEGHGTQEQEGLLRFGLRRAEVWVEGRLTLVKPSVSSDHVPFRELDMPAMLLTWRDASDENLPQTLADPVEPYRLGVTGRMTMFMVMSIAR